MEISTDLMTWSPVSAGGSPYIDPTASSEQRRFYRLNCFGNISRNYVGFYRMNFGPGYHFFANQLRPEDDRVVALLPSPPSGTAVFCSRSVTGGYCSITYLGGAWEGDDMNMRLSAGDGLVLNAPVSFTHTFIGEVALTSSNGLPAGLSLVSSSVPQDLPLTGVGRLGFPVAEGDEIYQFNRFTGGDTANTFLGGAWEGDGDGHAPVPALGESFWVRKRAPAVWVQTINQYSGPP
jgi:hypothetical protein